MRPITLPSAGASAIAVCPATAPVRFTTSIFSPMCFSRWRAARRARWSLPPPCTYGTTSCTLWPRRQLGQRLFRHLAESRDREVVAQEEPLGQLELGDLLPLEEIHQRLQVELLVLLQDHAGAHLLAEVRIRHRHAGDVLHRRMREDQVLDFLGADLLAAAIDQVLLSSLDDVVPGRMLAHQVA